MTFSINSSQSTHPTGQVLWEELLVLSRFHSLLRADEWNFCPLKGNTTRNVQNKKCTKYETCIYFVHFCYIDEEFMLNRDLSGPGSFIRVLFKLRIYRYQLTTGQVPSEKSLAVRA